MINLIDTTTSDSFESLSYTICSLLSILASEYVQPILSLAESQGQACAITGSASRAGEYGAHGVLCQSCLFLFIEVLDKHVRIYRTTSFHSLSSRQEHFANHVEDGVHKFHWEVCLNSRWQPHHFFVAKYEARREMIPCHYIHDRFLISTCLQSSTKCERRYGMCPCSVGAEHLQ